MINRVVITACLVMCITHALAITKCISKDGKISFQETTCAETDKALIVMPSMQPTQPNRADVQAQQKRNADAKNRIAIREAINERRPIIGMTYAELEQSIGLPQSINSTTSASGATQQRVYYFDSVTWYVYMSNGAVTSFQNAIGGLGRKTSTVPCPSAHEIRSVETSASSITLTDEQRRKYAQQLSEMRSCGK
ncbi:MAG: hypothetical protein WCG50_09185 [Rhodoferax sp.]|uniref:hypothetical protein n=1 Tax=Rhodoferax sp. TaxID=50421 RepID=UPI003016A341